MPIHKKQTRYDPLKYRSLNLTPVTCKSKERLLATHITNYLTEKKILSAHQFGFRATHSTVDQFLATYNDITLMIDAGMVVDIVFYDFSKAFDMVFIGLLIRKLYGIGIRCNPLAWINAFFQIVI